MQPGDIVYGKVTNIVPYGAFVVVGEYDGLIHISEFSDNYVRNIGDYIKVDQVIRLRVLEVDEENKRLKLGYKQIHKTRGIKCKVPQYKIGFASLETKLDDWIKGYKDEQ